MCFREKLCPSTLAEKRVSKPVLESQEACLTETGCDMDDRRRQDRKLMTYFSRVMDRNNGRLLGYLVDMTTGGALVIGNVPLRVNSIFQLRIDLPESYGERRELDIEARAIWSQPDPDPDLYRTGIQLIGVDPADLQILERLITDYGLTR